MKTTLNNTFLQLTIIYSILILLISLNIITKYTLQFQIFSIVIAISSIFLIKNKEISLNEKLIIIPLLIILTSRITPYINNNIPLGYDTGIYKYAIGQFPNLIDKWAIPTFTPLFLPLTVILSRLTNITFALIHFQIILELLLALTIYITVKLYFNKESALLSVFRFSLSIAQFKLFTHLYFQNLIALILLLSSFYFLKKSRILFILTASALAGIHKPTFLIFGLSYFVYFLIKKSKLWHLTDGIMILLISLTLYLKNFKEQIVQFLQPIIETNIGAGTFINFFQYQFSSLIYLPFSLIGIFHSIKEKKFDILLILIIINAIIVYFKLIFFNRFIIHLDLIMIIFSGYGILKLLEHKKVIGLTVTLILLISGGILIFKESISTKPLIDKDELEAIELLQDTEKDAFVMSTSSIYSPWLLGYSKRRTIAPGLFDYNKWNLDTWNKFWSTNSSEEAIEMLKDYEKPLYIFIGKNYQNRDTFNDKCFEEYYKRDKTEIYEFKC